MAVDSVVKYVLNHLDSTTRTAARHLIIRFLFMVYISDIDGMWRVYQGQIALNRKIEITNQTWLLNLLEH